MIYTNRLNLPPLVAEILQNDSFYDHDAAKGTLSATTLLRPVQEIVLCERHKDELTQDVGDRLWSLWGSGVHAIIEQFMRQHKGDVAYVEKRLKARICGEVVSGKFDILLGGNKIVDVKTTSAWTMVYGDRVEEWIAQLSIYRWLLSKSKKFETPLREANIMAWFRDWDKRKAQEIAKYPRFPVIELPIMLWEIEDTEKFLRDTIIDIKNARQFDDENQPPCSDRDRWERKGRYMKCESYCLGAPFCWQNKRGA